MRKTSTIGAAVIALAASGWIATASAQAPAPADTPAPAADTPAPDDKAPPKKMHHKMVPKHEKLKPTAAGDAAVDDLNAKSLDAAKEGKSFTPPTTPAPAKATPAKAEKKKLPAKHHAVKKAETSEAPPAPEAAAPAPAPEPAPAPAPAPAKPK